MKRVLIIVLAIIAISACKKDGTSPTLKNCVLVGYVHGISSGGDSAVIAYYTDSVSVTTYYPDGSKYKNTYVKSGSNYNFKIERLLPTYLQSNNGVLVMNGWGYVDTAYRFNSVTTLLNYTDKQIYDGSGHVIKYTNTYISGTTYSNIATFYFNSAGNIDYQRHLQYNFTTAMTTNNDSIVNQYYTDKPNRAPIDYAEQFLYGGKISTNLIKAQSFYDYLNGNTVRRTVTYSYTLNADNYVSQAIITNIDHVTPSTTIDTLRLYYACP
jgi:hypothetical protein